MEENRMQPNPALGTRVKLLRESRGLLRCELARLIKKSNTTITNIEAGKKGCRVDTLNDLARVLGVSTDTLLGNAELTEQDLAPQVDPQEVAV